MRAEATFVVDEFDGAAPHASHGTVDIARVAVTKTFSGDLDGTGTVEMVGVSTGEGRGYVAVEWIEGALGGVGGGFMLLHCAIDPGEAWWTIVPGSGQGGLAGIRGEATITIDADGTHRFNLDYHLEPTLG